jgi:hypothetical protein
MPTTEAAILRLSAIGKKWLVHEGDQALIKDMTTFEDNMATF